ncbi:MAG: hypothetical protein R2717_08285 [Schumannella sp.]|nr:hypothetical protein [Microbacteriaceae bacterium]
MSEGDRASEPQQPTVLPPGAGPAGAPQNVRAARPGDAVGSILLLILAFAGYLIGVILSFFGFLVTGVCAARSCNADAGTTAQAIVAVTLAVVLLLGSGISIALMVSRRRAIVVALVTLILIVVGWIVGVVAFFLALST